MAAIVTAPKNGRESPLGWLTAWKGAVWERHCKADQQGVATNGIKREGRREKLGLDDGPVKNREVGRAYFEG